MSPARDGRRAGGSGAETNGVTAADGGEGALVPNALVAVTVHVYAAPLVKTVMTIGDTAPVLLPGTPVLEVHDAV